MSYPQHPADKRKQTVEFGDSSIFDAFGRLRTSDPYGMYEFKQVHTNDGNNFLDVTAGSGTATYQYDRSSTYLTTTTASGDRSLRQTYRYFTYVPGKSMQILLTGVFGAPKANVNQYIGYGDDLNGLFFTYQGTDFGIIKRSSVSGSVVNTFYSSTASVANNGWNIDRLDGKGPSGKTIDLTKAQIFIIDFQWLGVGRVRFSFDIDGVIVPVHEILNANSIDSVYMKTPSLPIRYEVINTGAAASGTTLEQICCAIASEGGYLPPGTELCVGNGITKRAVTARTPILAVRLKNAFPAAKPNRRTLRYLRVNATASTNDVYIEVAHLHSPSAITATWADAMTGTSGVEFSTDITAITGNPEHVLDRFAVSTGLGSSSGALSSITDFISLHNFVSQNFDSTNSQAFVVYATAFTGTSNVSANMSYIEID